MTLKSKLIDIQSQKDAWVSQGKHFCEFCENYYPDGRKQINEGEWKTTWHDGTTKWACNDCDSSDIDHYITGMECVECNLYYPAKLSYKWHTIDLRGESNNSHDYCGYALVEHPSFICDKCFEDWVGRNNSCIQKAIKRNNQR